ncbi:hypothetical protein LJC74_04075 [Eubacteriales bacterium OttesenSCG-928-A19]|nr:hypothetical protein [Eubacteriales bacterium OttesenSCG-928-A19]
MSSIASLPEGKEMLFFAEEDGDCYGAVRTRFFDADVIVINYLGGGNPYIIDVEWQGEYAYAHILHGLKQYCDESNITSLFADIAGKEAERTEVRNLRDMDNAKLLCMRDVLALIHDYDDCDCGAAHLRDIYHESLGFDPIWRHHVGDDLHMGAVIIPVSRTFSAAVTMPLQSRCVPLAKQVVFLFTFYEIITNRKHISPLDFRGCSMLRYFVLATAVHAHYLPKCSILALHQQA